ncbi:helix-turn-helix transcriptional regulator [Nocardia sp. NPDC057668]|uniref:helix-turn-helix transcriptional regulator n=1 Tax=Nocardia sp. NPDC057668 TaxID=3346202 RepID=UPI003672DCBF
MTKTERLYALAEELRAYSPRPRSARQLAGRLEVTPRTIVRDIAALQQSGVPVRTVPGRNGGYALDRGRTLAPVSLTATEATALLVALPTLAGTPFAPAARSAVHKVLGVLTEGDRSAAAELSARIRLLPGESATAPPQVLEALIGRRVLRLAYTDRDGVTSARLVEPLGLIVGAHWYLSAWCLLRGAIRGFRLDRVVSAEVLPDRVPDRGIDLSLISTGDGKLIDVAAITDIPLSRKD